MIFAPNNTMFWCKVFTRFFVFVGVFDKNRLIKMIELIKSYHFISKEHNGDWVDIEIIKENQ